VTEHPSFLRLDRFALGVADAEVSSHLEACAACRGHLGRLEQPVPVPAWARELGEKRRTPIWRRLLAPGLVAVAALGGLLLVALPRTQEEPWDGRKGAPSVGVYVEREGRVFLWDGQQQLQPGDRIALKVAPEGFTRVTVAALDHGAAVELYAGAVEASGESTLARSFRLDAEPGDETLLVLFSRAPLPPKELEAAFAQPPRSRARWGVKLRLPKSAGRSGAP
jgi:hypothetical protein